MPASPFFNPLDHNFYQHKLLVGYSAGDLVHVADAYWTGLLETQHRHKYGRFVLTPMSSSVKWFAVLYNDSDYWKRFPLAGFCISHSDELIGVWSHGNGLLKDIVQAAKFMGAEYLSCYNAAGTDNTLAAMYTALGLHAKNIQAYDPNKSDMPIGSVKSVSHFDINPVRNTHVWQDAFTV